MIFDFNKKLSRPGLENTVINSNEFDINSSKMILDSSNQSLTNPNVYTPNDFLENIDILYLRKDGILLMKFDNSFNNLFVGQNISVIRGNFIKNFVIDSVGNFINSVTFLLTISNYDGSALDEDWYKDFIIPGNDHVNFTPAIETKILLTNDLEFCNERRNLVSSLTLEKSKKPNSFDLIVKNICNSSDVKKIIYRNRIKSDLLDKNSIHNFSLFNSITVDSTNGKANFPVMNLPLESDEYLEYYFSGVPVYNDSQYYTLEKGSGYSSTSLEATLDNNGRLKITGHFINGQLNSISVIDSGYNSINNINNKAINYLDIPIVKFIENGVDKGAEVKFNYFLIDRIDIKTQSNNFKRSYNGFTPYLSDTLSSSNFSTLLQFIVVNGGSGYVTGDQVMAYGDTNAIGNLIVDINGSITDVEIISLGSNLNGSIFIDTVHGVDAIIEIEEDITRRWKYFNGSPNTATLIPNLELNKQYELQVLAVSNNIEFDKYSDSVSYNYQIL